ncbi:hypothetical protein ACB092_03G126100 [Castanea dentata]
MDQSMRLLVNGGYTQLHQSGCMSVSGRMKLLLWVHFARKRSLFKTKRQDCVPQVSFLHKQQ